MKSGLQLSQISSETEKQSISCHKFLWEFPSNEQLVIYLADLELKCFFCYRADPNEWSRKHKNWNATHGWKKSQLILFTVNIRRSQKSIISFWSNLWARNSYLVAISHFIWNRKESVQLCHDRLAKLSLLLLTVISGRKVVYLDQTRQELVNIVLKGPNKKYTFGCFLYVHKLGTILTGGQ